MWLATVLLLVSILCFSQSKPLEKESLASSENVFDGILDKTFKCVEEGMTPYLSQLNDKDQDHWKTIGRAGIRSYVERMRDFLKHRDETMYSDEDTTEDDYTSSHGSEEYTDPIHIPLTVPPVESYSEHFVEGPKLTSESVVIEKIKKK